MGGERKGVEKRRDREEMKRRGREKEEMGM